MPGVYRPQYRGVLHNPADTKYGDGQEPDRHNRPKCPAYARSTKRLYREHRQQDGNGRRNDIRLDGRSCDGQSLERRKNRDRGCDRTVTVNQGRAEKTERDDNGPPLTLDREERHQSQYATLSVVV